MALRARVGPLAGRHVEALAAIIAVPACLTLQHSHLVGLFEDAFLAYGQKGEVVAKGPQVMQGYWNNPKGTAEMIKDGWLYTGNIGYMDEDGYIYLTSRKKDLIKPSGHQVWPREVEEVIATHPAIAEVGVAGIPDPKQGEAVKAWVVLREGKEITAEELRKFTREKLTGYKVPKFIEFRKALPKTMVGKVLRRVLQEEEQTKASKSK